MAKTQTVVKKHLKKTKRGQLKNVRQHVRKLSARQLLRQQRKQEFKMRLSKLKNDSFQRAIEQGKLMLRASNVDSVKMKLAFAKQEKQHAIKFVIKRLKMRDSDPKKIARRSEKIYKKLKRMHKKVFERVGKIRGKLKEKGMLNKPHPVNELRSGHKIKFHDTADLFGSWKVKKVASKDGIKTVHLINTRMKDIERSHPIGQLASWFDRGMFTIKGKHHKKHKMKAKVVDTLQQKTLGNPSNVKDARRLGVTLKEHEKRMILKKKVNPDNKGYMFLGTGHPVRLKRKSDLYKGRAFYNQDISKDKSWKETLKREGMKSAQISSVNKHTGALNVKFYEVKGGKLKLSEAKGVNPLKFVKILKTGRE